MKGNLAFKIETYDFDINNIDTIENYYVNNLWPVIYVLSDESIKQAYIGETTDAINRLRTHLKNDLKNKLKSFRIISSSKFNKSATIDIESLLIKYISADGKYKLLNGNLGIANHNYFQKKELYWNIFTEVWNKLRRDGIVKHSISQIDNSDLFKYSPYKSLTKEQIKGLFVIIDNLLDDSINNTIIEGGAGTGKTILAVFLFKLLNSELSELNFRDFGEDEISIRFKISKLKKKFQKPKMALVVPMSSFRNTLKKVFKNIKDLKANMVIGPADLTKTEYDIVLVDESHRLRRRVNLGAYFGAFDKNNKKLNLNKENSTELDWVLKQSKKSVLFYDEGQSIKPSDILKQDFDNLKSRDDSKIEYLKSQFRVKGGNLYSNYIDDILNCRPTKRILEFPGKYEFLMFNDIDSFIKEIKTRNDEVGLSRLIAGYSWKWISNKNHELFDIEIENTKLRWNTTNIDWVNSPNSIDEVGCIHTTQGYDLNYAGVIFGNEISYCKEKNEIIIIEENYYDINGKQSIKNPEELKEFIINIYRTILLRGISGTYVYICDKNLREYLSGFVALANNLEEFEDKKQPVMYDFKTKNSVAIYDLNAAAGDFNELQSIEGNKWIKLPNDLSASEDYFACRVIGESMNKIIKNDSICLFKKYRGGSRNGLIVLAQSSDIHDDNFGSGYTVKEYHSIKEQSEDSWGHTKIILKPLSFDTSYKDIELNAVEAFDFKIIGVFERVLY